MIYQNDLVKGLKNNNIWTSLDRLFVFVNGISPSVSGETFATIDWINPSGTTNSAFISSTPIYDSFSGFTNRGSSGGHINTRFNPATMGTAFTSTGNSILVGYSISGATATNAVYGARLNASASAQYSFLATTGGWRHQQNTTIMGAFTSPTLGLLRTGNVRAQVSLSGGTLGATGTTGSTLSFYLSGNTTGAGTPATPTTFGLPPNYEIYLCAVNNNGTAAYFAGNTFIRYFAVGGLVNASSADTVFNTYLSSFGIY